MLKVLFGERSIDMNWMDDGGNRNSTKPIEFKAIDVDYNISLPEAIKLSVEKSGYEAEIIKKDDTTNVNIKIPYLVKTEDDMIELELYKHIYWISLDVDIRVPQTSEEKMSILEYVNDNSGFVSFSWESEDNQNLISIFKSSWRLYPVDRDLKYGEINVAIGNACMDGDEELMQEKLALRERLEVYREEKLDFNMSAKWNATRGAEYRYILDDINYLISIVKKERENILRFI